jgi:hypothetical protein
MVALIQWSSLQNWVIKFKQNKMFYELYQCFLIKFYETDSVVLWFLVKIIKFRQTFFRHLVKISYSVSPWEFFFRLANIEFHSGRLWPYSHILDLPEKICLKMNTLAFSAASLAEKKVLLNQFIVCIELNYFTVVICSLTMSQSLSTSSNIYMEGWSLPM